MFTDGQKKLENVCHGVNLFYQVVLLDRYNQENVDFQQKSLQYQYWSKLVENLTKQTTNTKKTISANHKSLDTNEFFQTKVSVLYVIFMWKAINNIKPSSRRSVLLYVNGAETSVKKPLEI